MVNFLSKRIGRVMLFVLIFGSLTLPAVLIPKPVFASCQCIASSSAKITGGQWKTLSDGGAPCDYVGTYSEGVSCNPLSESYVNLWFCVPTVPELLGNIVRIIFFIAGILALFMLLLGGFEWVSSGGDDKKIQAAQTRISAAVIGLVVMVASLTLVIVIEQVIFGGKICLGISCPLDLGKIALIENLNPNGRRACFDRGSSVNPSKVASSSGSLQKPMMTATPSGSLQKGIKIATPSGILGTPTPTSTKRRVIIVTAMPSPKTSISPSSQPPNNPNVTILPYGSKVPSPTKVILPGTGGGGGPISEPPLIQF